MRASRRFLAAFAVLLAAAAVPAATVPLHGASPATSRVVVAAVAPLAAVGAVEGCILRCEDGVCLWVCD